MKEAYILQEITVNCDSTDWLQLNIAADSCIDFQNKERILIHSAVCQLHECNLLKQSTQIAEIVQLITKPWLSISIIPS